PLHGDPSPRGPSPSAAACQRSHDISASTFGESHLSSKNCLGPQSFPGGLGQPRPLPLPREAGYEPSLPRTAAQRRKREAFSSRSILLSSGVRSQSLKDLHPRLFQYPYASRAMKGTKNNHSTPSLTTRATTDSTRIPSGTRKAIP